MTDPKPEGNDSLVELLPEDLRQLQGRTPDELKDMLTLIEAHIRSIHQGEGGEIRELSDAERTAMNMAIDIRGKIIDRLDEHVRVQDVFRRRPQAVQQ